MKPEPQSERFRFFLLCLRGIFPGTGGRKKDRISIAGEEDENVWEGDLLLKEKMISFHATFNELGELTICGVICGLLRYLQELLLYMRRKPIPLLPLVPN